MIAHPFDARAADELAYRCAREVVSGRLDARSPIADALLDYLRVGESGGPPDAITWMREYESRKTT
jgi:predicted kinase